LRKTGHRTTTLMSTRHQGWSSVYRWIDCNVYRKSTERRPPTMQRREFSGISTYRAYYHQQYLAKNPRGYCPDHSCGVSFGPAELPVGEKA
jgi:hypothetical protein